MKRIALSIVMNTIAIATVQNNVQIEDARVLENLHP
jgi:hypothetical protein